MSYIIILTSKSYILHERAENLFKSDRYPELDVSTVLGPDETSYYQSLIGVMRWLIKIE